MTPHDRPADTDTPFSSLTVFLGLSLLLLAFFILLNSMAQPETVRARAALESIGAAFPSPTRPAEGHEQFVSRDGDFVAAKAFEAEVMGLFADLVPVERQTVAVPGREMMAVIAADSLFAPGSAEIIPSRMALLDRIAKALARHPPGMRFEVDVVLDAPSGEKGAGGKTSGLGAVRAGVFARSLLARGAPPDAVAVGLRPVSGAPRQTVFWFHVRTEDEARLPFLGRDGDGD